jgi:hypothetical protein
MLTLKSKGLAIHSNNIFFTMNRLKNFYYLCVTLIQILLCLDDGFASSRTKFIVNDNGFFYFNT